MSTELPINGAAAGSTAGTTDPTFTVKTGLARMLQGGVIMDVVNAEQVSLKCPPHWSSNKQWLIGFFA